MFFSIRCSSVSSPHLLIDLIVCCCLLFCYRCLALAGQSELVFAVQSYAEESSEVPNCVRFFAVGSGSGRQAHHPAQANFIELQREEPHQAPLE